MENKKVLVNLTRTIIAALAVFLTGAATAILENRFIEVIFQSIIIQVSLLAFLLFFLVVSAISYFKSKENDIIYKAIPILVCFVLVAFSTVNQIAIECRESTIMKRVVRVMTVEYSSPHHFTIPETNYYQAFLLDENHVLILTDIMFSNKQVFLLNEGNQFKLWPEKLKDSYCIAYFNGKIRLPKAVCVSATDCYSTKGDIDCYLRTQPSSTRIIQGSIIGEITNKYGMLATNISSSKVVDAGIKNVVPVSKDGKLLGFLTQDNNSGEYTEIVVLSSIFSENYSFSEFVMDTYIQLRDGADDVNNTNDDKEYKTITTYLKSTSSHSKISTPYLTCNYMHSYFVEDTHYYIYKFQWIIKEDEDSPFPVQGDAALYWENELNTEYPSAAKTNLKDQKLIGYTSWLCGTVYYPIKACSIETDIRRRTYIITDKSTIICDQGYCKANHYHYEEASRSGIYR